MVTVGGEAEAESRVQLCWFSRSLTESARVVLALRGMERLVGDEFTL